MPKVSPKVAIPAAAVVAGAVAIIMPFEGFSSRPYLDIVGKATYCYGETENVRWDKSYTRAECQALLEDRAYTGYYIPLTKCIPGYATLPQPTQEATLSFAYNLGTGAACNGSVGSLLSRGHIKEACDALLLYNKARIKGKLVKVKGLDKRRKAERQVCLQGA